MEYRALDRTRLGRGPEQEASSPIPRPSVDLTARPQGSPDGRGLLRFRDARRARELRARERAGVAPISPAVVPRDGPDEAGANRGFELYTVRSRPRERARCGRGYDQWPVTFDSQHRRLRLMIHRTHLQFRRRLRTRRNNHASRDDHSRNAAPDLIHEAWHRLPAFALPRPGDDRRKEHATVRRASKTERRGDTCPSHSTTGLLAPATCGRGDLPRTSSRALPIDV